MFMKVALTLLFLAMMVGVGIYSRRHSHSVDGFVLGTTLLFGKSAPYGETLRRIRDLKF